MAPSLSNIADNCLPCILPTVLEIFFMSIFCHFLKYQIMAVLTKFILDFLSNEYTNKLKRKNTQLYYPTLVTSNFCELSF